MNALKRTRGAVSVFLVMILVPCIVVTSVFVDLGRVHMSKSMAYSASDLALNSLLTNYDADLNEWYGMVASCQNINEFYKVSAQFFLRTISSQGLSDDEIYLLSDYYADTTNDDTIFDLLQIECQTAPSVMITEVSGANLSNATLIKDQVVEFMKYRAPIEITTDIISMFLKADGSKTEMASTILESDENAKLVEDKRKYYEAEGELLGKAFYSYVAIYTYYESAQTYGLNNAKLVEYVNKINQYKTAYRSIHSKVVSNLFNTSGLTKYSRVAIKIDEYNEEYDKTHEDVYTSKKTVDGEEKYYINKEDIEDLIEDLNNKVTDFNTAKTNFENAAASFMGKLPGSEDNQSNTIQWWVQMNQAVNSDNGHTKKYEDAAVAMLKAYSKVLAIDQCEKEDDVPSTWKDDYDYEEIIDQVEAIQEKYLKAGVTSSSDAYLKAVKQLEDVSLSNIDNISSSNLKITVDGQSKTIDAAIPYISTELSNLKTQLQGMVDELNEAIDGDGDEVPSLDQLKTLVRNYNTTFETWKNTANENDTSMKEYDKKSIEGTLTGEDASANVSREAAKITESSVVELKTRLTNIRNQLKNLINAIDSAKYGETKIVDIKTYSTFKAKTSKKVSAESIPLKNSELNNYSSTTFSQLFAPSGNIASLQHTDENEYNPDINPSESNTVDTPELFVYFHKQWNGKSKQQFEEAKEDEQKTKDAQDKFVEDEKTNASKYRGKGTDIARDFSDGKSFNAGTGMINSIAGLVTDISNGNFSGIRDDIYVTTYMTHMFSYATFDREGKYHLLDDEKKLKLDTKNFPDYYKSVEGDAKTEKTWLSTNPKDSYNKSLTNKMIEQGNNAAYLAELEYILYGNSTNQENLKSAFGEIYTIRFVLNTVSAFQNFWTAKNSTGEVINTIAGLISAAFSGVIPVPVIKAVMLPILAAVETCKDNSRLAAGMPVELYKSKPEQWWIKVPDGSLSYSSFFTDISKAFSGDSDLEKNKDEGLFYSDYLTFFVYVGLSGGGDVEKDMYLRMAEVIQSNMRKQDGIDDTYTLKKSKLYFKLEATIRVKPLMITLPFFNDEDYKNNMDTKTDWCTYTTSTVRGYS